MEINEFLTNTPKPDITQIKDPEERNACTWSLAHYFKRESLNPNSDPALCMFLIVHRVALGDQKKGEVVERLLQHLKVRTCM